MLLRERLLNLKFPEIDIVGAELKIKWPTTVKSNQTL